MSKKHRRWDGLVDDDPLAGLVNLFDLWMVFSIALLLALVGASRWQTDSDFNPLASESASNARPSEQQFKLDRFKISREKLTGEGDRLGTAYRLKNGEVVYVPD